MAQVKTETLVVLGVALAVIYLMTKAAGAATQTAKDAVQAINPFNNDNVFNQAATSLWQASTGSNGSIGTDIYDFVHKGEPYGGGAPLNYTPAQQAADQKATAQLEAGFHGM